MAESVSAPATGIEIRSHAARRVLAGFVLAIISGLALFVTLPGRGTVWPLVFVALVPAIFAQYRLLPRKLAPFALAIPMGIYGVGVILIVSSVSSVPLLAAGSLGPAILFFLLGIIDRRFAERTGYRLFLVQLPILWVGLEVLSVSPYTGSVGWLAYQLAPAPGLIQPISIFGTPALSLLLLIVNWGVALLIIGLVDRTRTPIDSIAVPMRRAATGFVVAVLVFALWSGLSLVLLGQVHSSQGPSVRVAAVQPGSSEVRQSNPANETSNPQLIAELASQTKEAATQGAKLVVWPEEILTFDPTTTRTAEITGIASANNVYLIVGYQGGRSDDADNAAVIINPQGEIIGTYYKIHPALFEGEHFDQPKLYEAWPTAIGDIGIIICFDADFPDTARLVTAAGARLIADPSWDFPSAAHYEIVPAQFRAVENRVAVVKAEHAWDSAIIGPDGSIIEKTINTRYRGEQALLVADVPLGPGGAPFTSWGYLFNYVIVLLALARLVAQPVVWLVQRHREKTLRPA